MKKQLRAEYAMTHQALTEYAIDGDVTAADLSPRRSAPHVCTPAELIQRTVCERERGEREREREREGEREREIERERERERERESDCRGGAGGAGAARSTDASSGRFPANSRGD
ncbi:unnamed protein product [Closterium sp. NIES-64]|nr:unnamed protein product [Closterium sp. NIES-64]